VTNLTKIYSEEKTASSTNIAGKTGYWHAENCSNLNSKWIKDLNTRPKTLKLVHERTGNTLEGRVTGNDFISRTQMAKQLRKRIDKWDYKKLKNLLHKQRNDHHIEE
jgi:hypothetical protein